jgi:F-type H+-transporting ATPase subunit delta
MQEIAEVYARALFEVAKEHDVLDDVHEQLDQFADALGESHDLQVFFFSPYFSSEEKKEAIGKIVEDADEHFVRFLEMLAERHRMPVVFRIRRELDSLWADENRLLPVTITSAVELDDDTVKKIQQEIEKQTGRRTELTTAVDPDVLGGLAVQVGNVIMDGTVRARLDRLRRQVATAA